MRLPLCLLLLFCTSFQVYGQKQLSATIGAGFPEIVNVGAKFRYKQIEVGGTVGYVNPTLSVTAESYFHFGGHSKYTTLRPWFFRLGADYVINDADRYGYLDFRAGRDINFSKRVGMSISGGLTLKVYERIKDSELNLDFPILPAIGAMFYYNFPL